MSTIVELAVALNIPPMLLLMGALEAQAIVERPDKLKSLPLEIPKDAVEQMQLNVDSGLLKRRLKAARLGALVISKALSQLKNSEISSGKQPEILAAILSAIIPGKGTIVGAALGSSLPGKQKQKVE